MVRVKKTILKVEEALDCMTIGTFGIDIRQVCQAQRDLTNMKWIEALESVEGIMAISKVIKTLDIGEPESTQAATSIVKLFTR